MLTAPSTSGTSRTTGCYWSERGNGRSPRSCQRAAVRRWSSLMPPHVPAASPVVKAHVRQRIITGHLRHTAVARAVWTTAGPLVPKGKNKSGSSRRHAALERESTSTSILSLGVQVMSCGGHRFPTNARAGTGARSAAGHESSVPCGYFATTRSSRPPTIMELMRQQHRWRPIRSSSDRCRWRRSSQVRFGAEPPRSRG